MYLAVTVRAAWLRPFVFHEFSTLFVSSTSTLRGMFQAVPADGNPPLYFFLARLCLKLPIKTELALRLPSIFAYFLAGLTVYWFVRRDAGRTHAWLALSVFLGCGWSVYAIDARPYPLLLFFTGLALCCWQAYCRSGNWIALAGITFSAAGAIYAHQYGVIYVLCPLFAGETVRSLKRGRIDPAVIAAGVVGALTVLRTFPPMFRGQKPLLEAIRNCPVFAARPHISDLKLYGAILPRFIPAMAILGVVLLLLWIALTPKRQPALAGSNIPAEDWVAAAMAALLIPAMLVVARFGTNYFQARYGIGSGLGIAMLCGMLLSRLRWRYADSLAWVAAAYCLTVGLLGLWFAGKAPGVTPWTDPVLHAGGSDEAIVVANATEFSPLWWYADEQMRSRVHYLSDLAYTARQTGLVPEYSLMLERAYLPMRLDSYQSFIAEHRHFLLYCSGDREFEWIKQRLADEGWRLRLLQSAPVVKVPGAKAERYREMFEVSR